MALLFPKLSSTIVFNKISLSLSLSYIYIYILVFFFFLNKCSFAEREASFKNIYKTS